MTRDEARARADAKPVAQRLRKEWDRDSTDYLAYRVRYLPLQLERARNRVAQLESEALRLGFRDLVQ